jgi:hypothetical protein
LCPTVTRRYKKETAARQRAQQEPVRSDAARGGQSFLKKTSEAGGTSEVLIEKNHGAVRGQGPTHGSVRACSYHPLHRIFAFVTAEQSFFV